MLDEQETKLSPDINLDAVTCPHLSCRERKPPLSQNTGLGGTVNSEGEQAQRGTLRRAASRGGAGCTATPCELPMNLGQALDLTQDQLLDLYRQLYRIRRVERVLAAVYPKGEMRMPVHFSIGQEAVAVGVCAALTPEDHIYSTHRCHAHYLAKGGDLQAMVNELHGRSTGCTAGIGGSMHLADMSVGMMGTSAIVGSSIAIAVGSALAFRLQYYGGVDGQGKSTATTSTMPSPVSTPHPVVVAFVGDSGPETGVFWESLNFAALHRLPIVFVIENNMYSTQTPLDQRQPDDRLWRRGHGLDIPGISLQGNSVLHIYRTTAVQVARARSGLGPSIMEVKTYRWLEHVGPNEDYDMGYRDRRELEAAEAHDPVFEYRDKLIKMGTEAKTLEEIETSIEHEIRSAIP